MKLSLQVTVGTAAGRVIPITISEFVIGRDPQCQLRPASALISKRHCAFYVRDGKAFIKDFDSTNGTLVNDQRVEGERELRHDDKVAVGPLAFVVRLEAPVPVNRPTPPPAPPAPAKSGDDEAVAEMLLAMQDDSDAAVANGVNREVPEGSTVLDMPAVPPPEEEKPVHALSKKTEKKKEPSMNTASAAEAILAKYSRRHRNRQ
jgi:pSer/pThr/pTyr-binding forkhead associated (FHA) protein